MALINMDTITAHGELNFVNDALPCRLNPEHRTSLQNVIRSRIFELNTRSSHNFSESVALNEQLMFGLIFLLLADDSSDNRRNTLNNNMRQFGLQLLHNEVHFVSREVKRLNMQFTIGL